MKLALKFLQLSVESTLIVTDSGGVYQVQLTVTNGGCSVSDLVTIGIRASVKAPNVFTPNGDGENDVFVIEGVGSYPNSSVVIYNRWGGVVYKTDNYASNPWDGRDVPDGVYYFVVNLGPEQEKGEGHSGVIHVLK